MVWPVYGQPRRADPGSFPGPLLRTDADPGFSWVDLTHGLKYQYDLSINQAQVTPAIEPYAKRINEANVRLWEILPPRLIDAPADWSDIWFEAASKLDVSTMEFILMQGFDVNARDKDGADALFYAVAPWGGSFKAVELLVEAGAKLDAVDQLIQMGADSVSGPGEANEHHQITLPEKQGCAARHRENQ